MKWVEVSPKTTMATKGSTSPPYSSASSFFSSNGLCNRRHGRPNQEDAIGRNNLGMGRHASKRLTKNNARKDHREEAFLLINWWLEKKSYKEPRKQDKNNQHATSFFMPEVSIAVAKRLTSVL